MLRVLLVAGVAFCLVACVGCPRSPQAGTPNATPAVQPAPARAEPAAALTVFAAASLTEAFDAFSDAFTQSHPSIAVSTNYAGTQELRTQVEQGARPDVFASASVDDMASLVKAGLVKDPVVLAKSRLCVVAAKEPGKVRTLQDLAKPGLRLVVATETCPVGKYTRQCWEKMTGSRGFGPEFVAALKRNVQSEETNVKLVLAKVQLGEADAGFAYRSDVGGAKVIALELPQDVVVEATYEVGLGAETKNEDAARALVTALLGPEGQLALTTAGLEPPPPPKR